MKIIIEWWRLFYPDKTVYNYHVITSNGNNLLHTTQGYSKKEFMMYVIAELFPDAEVKQIADKYSKHYCGRQKVL